MSAPFISGHAPSETFCVSFKYLITSPSIVLHVAIGPMFIRPLEPPTIVKTLTFRKLQFDGGDCQITINRTNAERVFLIAEKVSFTISVAEVFVRHVNVSEGECAGAVTHTQQQPVDKSDRRRRPMSHYMSLIYAESSGY